MPYATEDRSFTFEARPVPLKEGYLLADGARIYKGTFCGVQAADGKLSNITDANRGALNVILFTDEQLHADRFNDRVQNSGDNPASVDALSEFTPFVAGDGSFAPGDEGSEVFLAAGSDYVVTKTDAGDGSTPYVGKLKKVYDPSYVAVYIPGNFRD